MENKLFREDDPQDFLCLHMFKKPNIFNFDGLGRKSSYE